MGFEETGISPARIVVPEGDFEGLFLDDPMAFHVVDIEGSDIGMVPHESFESREIIFQHGDGLERPDGKIALAFDEQGAG